MHEILIYDQIGDSFFFEGVSDEAIVKELKAHEDEEILIRINSPGGSVFKGMAIYNAIKAHPKKVITQVDGVAASAASVIAMAGDEIRMGEGTFMMIHEAWTCACGSVTDLLETAEFLKKIDDEINLTYVKRTGQSAEKITAMVKAETWLTPSEAIEMGFADAMVEYPEKEKPANVSNLMDYKVSKQFKNVPVALLNKEAPGPGKKKKNTLQIDLEFSPEAKEAINALSNAGKILTEILEPAEETEPDTWAVSLKKRRLQLEA